MNRCRKRGQTARSATLQRRSERAAKFALIDRRAAIARGVR